MTKSAMIRARIDPQLKIEAETILHDLGLSTTQALTLYYQQIRLYRGIPFDVRLPSESSMQPRVPSRAADTFVPFPVDENRSVMEQNVEAFKSMHGQLVKDYLGRYVAICDGQLVDRDSDPVALLKRVRAQYPDKVVLRQRVEDLPPRDLRVRHPQFDEAL